MISDQMMEDALAAYRAQPDHRRGAIPGGSLGQMIPRWADGSLAGHNWLGRTLMMAREVLS